MSSREGGLIMFRIGRESGKGTGEWSLGEGEISAGYRNCM